jgi:uncharacterized membrane protein
MGFDDYFEHKKRYRRFDSYHENAHPSDHEYLQGYGGGRKMEHYGIYLVNKVWNNSKLRLLFIVVSIFLVIVVILLLIALFPFIAKIVDSIAQIGIKGITENVTAFIEKLWSGSGS